MDELSPMSPVQNDKGLRLYNRPYTEKLLETLAHESGFPIAFQSDQFNRLLDLMFSKRLVICKIYDDESWAQINQAWAERRHFHMVPRWKKPEEPVLVPIPDPIPLSSIAQPSPPAIGASSVLTIPLGGLTVHG